MLKIWTFMKKIITYGAGLALLLLVVVTAMVIYKFYATQVYINSDNNLYFSGKITFENVTKIKGVYTRSENKPRILHINSAGGIAGAGGKLGEWIYQKQLHVLVTDKCYSACANYIFPAGKTSILGRRAKLGWHGGAHSKYLRIESKYVVADDKDKTVELGKVLEREFYERIKIDPQLPTYGEGVCYQEFHGGGDYSVGYKMFYYSLKDMKKMGIDIVLKNGKWNTPVKSNFYKVTLSDDYTFPY